MNVTARRNFKWVKCSGFSPDWGFGVNFDEFYSGSRLYYIQFGKWKLGFILEA